MKSLNLVLSLALSLAASSSFAASTTRSNIKDYNYVCMHITKPEALVFKTSSPQRIWKTSINKDGQIKKEQAIQLGQIIINAQNSKNKMAAFKADLGIGYQIKGSIETDIDGELPLTVTSSYLPDGAPSSAKDHYNCELQKSTRIGSVGKNSQEN